MLKNSRNDWTINYPLNVSSGRVFLQAGKEGCFAGLLPDRGMNDWESLPKPTIKI